MATRPHSFWRLPDIIDYECFLNTDERESPEALHARDRAFFLEAIEPSLPPADAIAQRKKKAADRERRTILRRWLDCRRELELKRSNASGQEIILPGDAFGQINGMTRWWLIILGALTGWGLATAALMYSAGAEPINAFTFFVEFAVIQAVILLCAFAVLLLRHWFPNWKIPSLMRLLWRIMAGLARNLWRKNRVRIAGATRQNAEAVFGILKARNTLYGSTFLWSLVLLTQAFAISFNVGALGAMTTRHLFHDLDFGWESTWLNAEQVTRGVRVAAAPWSWAVQPGHPSAEQVDKSQNRKRRDLAKLDDQSLKSWSNFLFGSVICYGLLPRVALLLFAAWAQRGALRRLRFNDGRSAQLLNRLRTPTVQTHSSGHGTQPQQSGARNLAGSLAWAPDPAAAAASNSSLPEHPPNVSPAAPAYWPQVPTAAPMAAAPPVTPKEATPSITGLKSVTPSPLNEAGWAPAKTELPATARPPIPAPHPRPPIIPPTVKITLPSANQSAAPAAKPSPTPTASPEKTPTQPKPVEIPAPATVPKATALEPVTERRSQTPVQQPPDAVAKIASTPAATPSPAKSAPAAIAPSPAPATEPTKPPMVAPAVAPPSAKASPVAEPAKPAAPAPVIAPKTAPEPAPVLPLSPASAAAAPALVKPTMPVAVPAPPHAQKPPESADPPNAPRAFATAEPLLILNLTGRSFNAAQAAETAGRPSTNGSAALFEAGTLSLEQDEQSFTALKQRSAAQPEAEVFALIPSWTAPMVASKLLLDQLRASVGRDRLIYLVLVGRPAPDGAYKPVRPNDHTLWSAAVQARGDAYLSLF